MKKNQQSIASAMRTAAALAAALVIFGLVSCDSAIRSSPDNGYQPVRSVSREAVGDPGTWSAITNSDFTNIFGTNQLNAAGYSPALGAYFVADATGTLAYTQPGAGQDPNSGSWSQVADPGVSGNVIWSITPGTVGGRPATLITAGGGYAAYSTGGSQWTSIQPLGSTFIDTIYASAYNSGTWVVGGYHGSAAWSADGLKWNPIGDLYNIFSPNGSIIRGIAVGELEGINYFVAVGGTSGPRPMPNAAAYSTNAVNWIQLDNDIFCKPVVYGDEKFVAAGYNIDSGVTYNAAYTDSSTVAPFQWVQQTTGSTSIGGWAQALAFAPNQVPSRPGTFVMGGASGEISYSTDGIKWYPASTTGFSGFVNGMAYGKPTTSSTGFFIAVGDSGSASWTTP
jgi:hypothetical protein